MSALKQPEPSGLGMAGAAFYCGLIGAILALVVLVWSTTSIISSDPIDPPEPNPLIDVIMFAITVSALACGVCSVIFGAAAGSQAKRSGMKPAPHCRAGLVMGIAALLFLLINLMVAVILGLSKTLSAPIEYKKRHQTVKTLKAGFPQSERPLSG